MNGLLEREVLSSAWLLQIHLEPATLRLEPPTAEQFHTDLQELFTTGTTLFRLPSAHICIKHTQVSFCTLHKIASSSLGVWPPMQTLKLFFLLHSEP